MPTKTDNSSRPALVTGATGLLGSHIAEQLRRRGFPVRALCRPGSETAFLNRLGCDIVVGDLSDSRMLHEACIGVDCVYHSAARVGDWGPWDEFFEVSVRGTQRLLGAAQQARVRRFLHISSVSVYGHLNGEGRVFDETTPIGQNVYRWSYYTRAKVEAERLVWDAHRQNRIQATVVRPSWMYGERDRASLPRLINSIRTRKLRIIGDGQNRLNLVHAGNVAECAILAAGSPQAIGEAYNASHDGIITQEQFFQALCDALGQPPVERRVPYALAHTAAFTLECLGHALRLGSPPLVTRYSIWLMGRRCFFECRKAREQLGWTSTVSYASGIPAAVADYMCHAAAAPRAA